MRPVKRFNGWCAPQIHREGGMAVVRPDDADGYYFDESSAAAAVVGRQRIELPDTQGFPCFFEFE